MATPPLPTTRINRLRSTEPNAPVMVDSPLRFSRAQDLADLLAPLSDVLASFAAAAEEYPDVLARLNEITRGPVALGTVPQLNLEAHCAEAIDRRIAGKSKSTNAPIYTFQRHNGQPLFVRNADCWASEIDLTSLSPSNSSGGGQRAGTLIAPDIIVMANHFPITNGATIRFVAMDGTIVNRTLLDQRQVGATDIQIGRLNSPLPDTIRPVKLLPAGSASQASWVGLPACKTDQDEKLLVSNIADLTDNDFSLEPPPTLSGQRLAFHEDWVTFDSGSPAFIILNNELVLLGCAATASGGPLLGGYMTEIAAKIVELGSSETIKVASLPVRQTVRYEEVIGFPQTSGGFGAADSGKVAIFNADGGLKATIESGIAPAVAGQANGVGRTALRGIAEEGKAVLGLTESGTAVSGFAADSSGWAAEFGDDSGNGSVRISRYGTLSWTAEDAKADTRTNLGLSYGRIFTWTGLHTFSGGIAGSVATFGISGLVKVYQGSGGGGGTGKVMFGYSDSFYWSLARDNDSTGRMMLGDQTGEKVSILSNGNVGIGDTNPSSKLTVGGDAFVDGNIVAQYNLEVGGEGHVGGDFYVNGVLRPSAMMVPVDGTPQDVFNNENGFFFDLYGKAVTAQYAYVAGDAGLIVANSGHVFQPEIGFGGYNGFVSSLPASGLKASLAANAVVVYDSGSSDTIAVVMEAKDFGGYVGVTFTSYQDGQPYNGTGDTSLNVTNVNATEVTTASHYLGLNDVFGLGGSIYGDGSSVAIATPLYLGNRTLGTLPDPTSVPGAVLDISDFTIGTGVCKAIGANWIDLTTGNPVA